MRLASACESTWAEVRKTRYTGSPQAANVPIRIPAYGVLARPRFSKQDECSEKIKCMFGAAVPSMREKLVTVEVYPY